MQQSAPQRLAVSNSAGSTPFLGLHEQEQTALLLHNCAEEVEKGLIFSIVPDRHNPLQMGDSGSVIADHRRNRTTRRSLLT
jgi:hypothetical protein